jgi:hypothetical protein
MSKVILIGVSLAVGIGLGTFLDRSLLKTPPSSVSIEAGADGIAPSAPLQVAVQASGNSVVLDLEPMRAMMREELAAALAKSQRNGSAQQASAQVSVSAATPQQQREALQAADTLINSGHWGNEERNAFHQRLALLDPQQREQAMQQLVQALNNGSLKASTTGSPL